MTTFEPDTYLFKYHANPKNVVYIFQESDGIFPDVADAVIPKVGTMITKCDKDFEEPLTLAYLHEIIPDPTNLGRIFKNMTKEQLFQQRLKNPIDLSESIAQMACAQVNCSPDFLTALNLALKHAHDVVVLDGMIYQYDGFNYVDTASTTQAFVTKTLIGLNGPVIIASSIRNSTFSAVASMFELIMDAFNKELRVDTDCPHIARCRDAMFVDGIVTPSSANFFSRKFFDVTLYGPKTYIPNSPIMHSERLLQWFKVLFLQNDSIHWILSLLKHTLQGKNFKVAVFLVGSGNSGKTTFLEFIKRMFGNAACSFNAGSVTQMSGETARPDLVKLLTHNIAIAEECTKLNPETFKLLSGSDSEIHLRNLHSNGITGAITSTMFFAMNDWPKFDTFPDTAVLNRMCPFRLDTDMTRYESANYYTKEYYSAMFQMVMNANWCLKDYPMQVMLNRKRFLDVANRNASHATLSKLDEYRADPSSTELVTPAMLDIDPSNLRYWEAIIGRRGGVWCNTRMCWTGLTRIAPEPVMCHITTLKPLLEEHSK